MVRHTLKILKFFKVCLTILGHYALKGLDVYKFWTNLNLNVHINQVFIKNVYDPFVIVVFN